MERWCEVHGLERGAVMSVEQCWQLARRWYQGRLEQEWQRPTPEQMEGIFAEVGLRGPFWTVR